MASWYTNRCATPACKTYTHVTTCPHPLLSRHTSGRGMPFLSSAAPGPLEVFFIPGPICGLDASSRLHLTLGLIFCIQKKAAITGGLLAEEVGFEPTGAVTPQRFSLPLYVTIAKQSHAFQVLLRFQDVGHFVCCGLDHVITVSGPLQVNFIIVINNNTRCYLESVNPDLGVSSMVSTHL